MATVTAMFTPTAVWSPTARWSSHSPATGMLLPAWPFTRKPREKKPAASSRRISHCGVRVDEISVGRLATLGRTVAVVTVTPTSGTARAQLMA